MRDSIIPAFMKRIKIILKKQYSLNMVVTGKESEYENSTDIFKKKR